MTGTVDLAAVAIVAALSLALRQKRGGRMSKAELDAVFMGAGMWPFILSVVVLGAAGLAALHPVCCVACIIVGTRPASPLQALAAVKGVLA
ncbi:hypothetical protein [Jiella sp. M17.18]|uniref:hypothetical protein n=1 Tax=Jiella sp. M17.18 TaxID=3234247 RepID=UPI0034DE779F